MKNLFPHFIFAVALSVSTACKTTKERSSLASSTGETVSVQENTFGTAGWVSCQKNSIGGYVLVGRDGYRYDFGDPHLRADDCERLAKNSERGVLCVRYPQDQIGLFPYALIDLITHEPWVDPNSTLNKYTCSLLARNAGPRGICMITADQQNTELRYRKKVVHVWPNGSTVDAGPKCWNMAQSTAITETVTSSSEISYTAEPIDKISTEELIRLSGVITEAPTIVPGAGTIRIVLTTMELGIITVFIAGPESEHPTTKLRLSEGSHLTKMLGSRVKVTAIRGQNGDFTALSLVQE